MIKTSKTEDGFRLGWESWLVLGFAAVAVDFTWSVGSLIVALGLSDRPLIDEPVRATIRPDLGRLTAGLLLAAVLLATAVWLIRQTDWQPVDEE